MTDQPQQPTAPAAPQAAVAKAPEPCPPGAWALVLTPLTPGAPLDNTVTEYEGGGAKFNLATPEVKATFFCVDRKAVAAALWAYLSLAPAVLGEHNIEVIVKSGKKQRKFMLRDLLNVLASFQVENSIQAARDEEAKQQPPVVAEAQQ